MKTMKTLLCVAASLAGPARAFADEAPAAVATPAADALAKAQLELSTAQSAVTTATQAEQDAKAAVTSAETALKGATDETKDGLKSSLKTAKDNHSNASKELKAAKTVQGKAEKAVTKAQGAATRESEKLAKAEAKRAEAAERAAARTTAKVQQNGITRPKDGTLTSQAWDIFDQISRTNGSPASIGEALPIAKAKGLNPNMTRSQYASWRKFHSVTGRIEAPKPPAPPAEPAAAPAA